MGYTVKALVGDGYKTHLILVHGISNLSTIEFGAQLSIGDDGSTSLTRVLPFPATNGGSVYQHVNVRPRTYNEI